MIDPVFANISRILERDSKATTYKFALLRGVIDIIQDNSPYIFHGGDRVSIPTGLLIEKWLLYYYPLIEAGIPQINGQSSLAFGSVFKKIISAYRDHQNGFSGFYRDLKSAGIPDAIRSDFSTLCRQMYRTITTMPMKHIGYSLSNTFYSIFTFETVKAERCPDKLDINYLIYNFGSFSIPLDYFQAFRIFGSFINGQESIVFKWAEFSVSASKQRLSVENVFDKVLKSPVTEREANEATKFFSTEMKAGGTLLCVWTGRPLKNYDVDHVIPFSVWKNNDLWNLLPAAKDINNRKRDKIPSPDMIEKSKIRILHYWQRLSDHNPVRFQRELKFSLLGDHPGTDWRTSAIGKLQNNCNYLISERGYEEWKI